MLSMQVPNGSLDLRVTPCSSVVWPNVLHHSWSDRYDAWPDVSVWWVSHFELYVPRKTVLIVFTHFYLSFSRIVPYRFKNLYPFLRSLTSCARPSLFAAWRAYSWNEQYLPETFPTRRSPPSKQLSRWCRNTWRRDRQNTDGGGSWENKWIYLSWILNWSIQSIIIIINFII